jgi:hypothetical protein
LNLGSLLSLAFSQSLDMLYTLKIELSLNVYAVNSVRITSELKRAENESKKYIKQVVD